jgi:hypothetical protein
MIYNTSQHPRPPTATHCLYKPYIYFGEGAGEARQYVEGQQYTRIAPSSGQHFTSWVENTNHE